jgi:hypothetical protein
LAFLVFSKPFPGWFVPISSPSKRMIRNNWPVLTSAAASWHLLQDLGGPFEAPMTVWWSLVWFSDDTNDIVTGWWCGTWILWLYIYWD